MATTIRLFFCALAAAGLAGPGPANAETPHAASRGRVLVLDNERTLEGDVVREGDRYRVRRSVGETWVPADKALALCATYEEAHTYLQGRANLGDPDERLRLARWCQLRGLREQALKEATEALK